MFGWRKRNDGFEWHQYVRTTIKLRREARRDKAGRLKQQAADGVMAAGAAVAAGAKVAGAAAAEGVKVAGAAAGAAARDGARHVGAGSRVAAASLGRSSRLGSGLIGRLAGHVRGWLAKIGRELLRLVRPLLEVLGRPGVGGPLLMAGAIALSAGCLRAMILADLDHEAAIATLIGAVALTLVALPRLLLGTGVALPGFLGVSGQLSRRAIAVGLAALLVFAGITSIWRGGLSLSNLTSLPALPFAGAQTIEGRGAALGGDLVRVGAIVVRLSGIEAPERDQFCTRSGTRRWRCGEAANAALGRLVNGRALTCEVKAADAAGERPGICRDGTAEINGLLVRGGHVFAASGLLSRYGSQEAEAKAAKAGLWSGDNERPALWRTRVWEDAKRRAPSGCPIKGQVAGAARTYVLPWSSEYDRIRVNPARGGRWFCSEEEAIAAGWKVAGRG